MGLLRFESCPEPERQTLPERLQKRTSCMGQYCILPADETLSVCMFKGDGL